jgi:hypothetical protein
VKEECNEFLNGWNKIGAMDIFGEGMLKLCAGIFCSVLKREPDVKLQGYVLYN